MIGSELTNTKHYFVRGAAQYSCSSILQSFNKHYEYMISVKYLSFSSLINLESHKNKLLLIIIDTVHNIDKLYTKFN